MKKIDNSIYVTQPYLPPLEEYISYITKIWDTKILTNNGPLVIELEGKLAKYLNVSNVILVTNGTIALQFIIRALGLSGEIITTPFSFVATTSSILWENCTPKFVDICKKDFNINSDKIEKYINSNTTAILPTHVFGYPCDIDKIGRIGKKYNLKVVYDAAHSFGVSYNNKNLAQFGDASILSFHATKLFHTVEGGAIITNDNDLAEKIKQIRNFGYSESETDKIVELGINGKMSEYHAAMGLAILPHIDKIIERRRENYLSYLSLFKNSLPLRLPFLSNELKYNYHYFPIVFDNEDQLIKVNELLQLNRIYARRYFYPSLNTISFTGYQSADISVSISKRTLCLPLYYDLSVETIEKITTLINHVFD